jgi:hypothetical protein
MILQASKKPFLERHKDDIMVGAWTQEDVFSRKLTARFSLPYLLIHGSLFKAFKLYNITISDLGRTVELAEDYGLKITIGSYQYGFRHLRKLIEVKHFPE